MNFLSFSKVNTNGIELNPSFSSATLHTASSLQTIATETKDIYPFERAYENPAMTIKDEEK